MAVCILCSVFKITRHSRRPTVNETTKAIYKGRGNRNVFFFLGGGTLKFLPREIFLNLVSFEKKRNKKTKKTKKRKKKNSYRTFPSLHWTFQKRRGSFLMFLQIKLQRNACGMRF